MTQRGETLNLQTVAEQFLAEVHAPAGTDPALLAWACRLRLHPRRRRGAALRNGRHLFFDCRLPREEQRQIILSYVARVIVMRRGIRPTSTALHHVIKAIEKCSAPSRMVIAV